MITVAVFCGSRVGIDHRYLRQAAAVGKEAADRDYAVVVGGGLTSCIGAIVNAAQGRGAHVTAVVPAVVMERDPPRDLPDNVVLTSDVWTWKREIIQLADAFLVLPGGLGTLTELFEVWSDRLLGVHDKPIVVVDGTGVFALLREFVGHLIDQGLSRAQIMDAVHWTDSVVGAFDYLDAQHGPPHEQPGGHHVTRPGDHR